MILVNIKDFNNVDIIPVEEKEEIILNIINDIK